MKLQFLNGCIEGLLHTTLGQCRIRLRPPDQHLTEPLCGFLLGIDNRNRLWRALGKTTAGGGHSQTKPLVRPDFSNTLRKLMVLNALAVQGKQNKVAACAFSVSGDEQPERMIHLAERQKYTV